jgi:hypothetical protein
MSDVNVRLVLSDHRLVLNDRLVFRIRPNTRCGRSFILGELKPNEKKCFLCIHHPSFIVSPNSASYKKIELMQELFHTGLLSFNSI